MRSLFVVPLLFFLAFSLTSGQDHSQANSQSNQAAQTATANGQNGTPVEVASAEQGQTASQNKKPTTTEESRPWLTHGEWVMSILTAIYVGATIVYVRISYKTLKAIEDQGAHAREEAETGDTRFESQLKVSQDAASAALLNSRAIVNSERPWLFIEIRVSDIKGADVPEHLGFSVSFKNWGKTPAEVVMFDQHLEPYGMHPEQELPVPAEYSMEGNVLAHTRMIPAGESFRDPGESYFSSSQYLLDDDWQLVRRSQKRLLYWGRLQYRDLIEQPQTIHGLKNPPTLHETCFCYFWSPAMNTFLICGPFGYNRHT